MIDPFQKRGPISFLIALGFYTFCAITVVAFYLTNKFWAFLINYSERKLPKCKICSRAMIPEEDCGGDCVYCLGEAGDPECVKHVRPSRHELQEMPLEWLWGYYAAIQQSDPQEAFNESLKEGESDDFTKGWQAACIDKGAKHE